MRFIELFAGIGGFRYGLEQTNQTREQEPKQEGAVRRDLLRARNIRGSDEWREQPQSQERYRLFNGVYRCVWANELNKYACQIYRKHWREICEQDIRTVDSSTIPEHDLITAGFPCQSFSIAGKRGGFEDTRGTLFFEICRIARAKGTPYLLLENVKGLLSHDEGRTFETIIGTLDELGYDCQWQVLNSKDFDVPQNRERVFIIGHLRGQPRPKVFPIGETGELPIQTTREIRYGEDNITGCLTEGWARMRMDNSITFTKSNLGIRRLTPIECERLQGFPDKWTEGISDTQRYKCLGNAVTTNIIEAIGRQWLVK